MASSQEDAQWAKRQETHDQSFEVVWTSIFGHPLVAEPPAYDRKGLVFWHDESQTAR